MKTANHGFDIGIYSIRHYAEDMRFGKGISKLQAILIIDIIIVASAAGAFVYVQALPGSNLTAEQTQIIGLQVTPSIVLIGEEVMASVNVTNISGEKGTFVANMSLDGTQNQAQTLSLAAGETKTVNFTISGAAEGTHTVKIGNLEGSFTVSSPYTISDLAINRTQAKVGEAIGISVTITNKASSSTDYSLTLSLNDSDINTISGQVDGSASKSVLFEVVEQKEGTYQVKVGGLNGTFSITSAAPPPKPAEFEVANLTVDPEITQPGVSVNVTAKVTNVGELSGSTSIQCIVNGEVSSAQTVQLSGSETTSVVFIVTEGVKGNYTISVGNLTATLSVQDPSTIRITGMFVKPYEVQAGQPVTIIVSGSNPGSSESSLPLKVKVDGILVQTQTLTIAPGSSGSLTITLTAEPLQGGDSQIHVIDVSGTQGGYLVVKDGYHTLNVAISPQGDADFNVTYPDGHTEKHTTFWSALLPEGVYTVAMPQTDPTGRVTFQNWEDGTTSLAKTIDLTTATSLTADYTGGSSCPVLYMWNGTENTYVSDISNHGWLGYINALNSDGSLTYYRNNPWDYVPLNGSQLQATNGAFNLTIMQKYNEIFYLDQAYMVAVDHPAGTSVYSTMVEQYLDPNYMGNIYTINNTSLKTPVSAVNEKGENVLPQISKMDSIFTSGSSGCTSPAWNDISWNRITLNLGDLSGAKQVKLVVRAIVDWGNPDDYTNWLNNFFAQPVPDGTQVTPPPYMEVKDAHGNWMRVPDGREFPLPSDGAARTYVIDLTGLFPTNDYSLRISNFWNVTFDYIGVDTSSQQNITVQKINPQAYLYQAFSAGNASATGDFTKYGNVTQLVLGEDDMFVIGRQGDAVSLQFPTSNLTAVPQGMVRDYFLYEASWFKDENGNWGFGFGFTVDPLPFQNMSGFPYPPSEGYPNDTAHQNYLQQWNTRVVQTVDSQNAQTNGFSGVSNFAVVVMPIIALGNVATLAGFGWVAARSVRQKRLKR
ncbi:MAG TPA: CARDB domain-containing protein [Candidatus Nanoarchaeia archaeon]|nr:CARDB domain-containing protein [Candidatus Nanoarchaeia archaeon]